MGMCSPSGGIVNMRDARVGAGFRFFLPNTRLDLRNSSGFRIQQIWYGYDGIAVWSRDYRHGDRGGQHEFPHDHQWVGGRRVNQNLPMNTDYC